MNNIDPPNRYGRAAARTAEPPAKLAASANGKIGKQQLDAAITLPTAARPASALRRCSLIIAPLLLATPPESFPPAVIRRGSAGKRKPSPARFASPRRYPIRSLES